MPIYIFPTFPDGLEPLGNVRKVSGGDLNNTYTAIISSFLSTGFKAIWTAGVPSSSTISLQVDFVDPGPVAVWRCGSLSLVTT